jgi:hypothetical protein
MKLIPIKDRMDHKPKKRIDFYPENFKKPRENIVDAIKCRYYEKLIEVAAREEDAIKRSSSCAYR